MRLVLTDADGRLLFCGQTRPGSIHDHLTQVRQAGLVELPALTSCPPSPRRTRPNARPTATKRIRVEQGISHWTTWRARSPHLGRREHLATILRAVAGLVRGRRPARPVDGHPRDHPNAFELLPPDWVGWTHPVKVKTVRSRPELTRWCRVRGSTVTEFDGRAPRRVLALLHRAADEGMTP